MAVRLCVFLPLVAMALVSSGCGILLQSALGWTSESRTISEKTHTIQVKSKPEGAVITRTGPDGVKNLGPAPLTDSIAYQHELVTESPSTLGLLVGGAVEIAGAIGSFAAASSGTDCLVEARCGSNIGWFVLGGTLVYLGGQDLVIALIYGLSGEQVKANRSVDGPLLEYTATVAGRPPVDRKIKVPDSSMVELSIGGDATTPVLAQAPPAATPPPPPPKVPPMGGSVLSTKWVVAVMDVEDLNAKTEKGVEVGLVRDLGDQLRIFIAQSGVRTIDRSAQERALKEQIQEAKSSSYKACYDDSCQIELGKALAASHILRSRITRFGTRCVLNAELIDLRAEVTVKAASARGDCRAEGFLNMSEEVAENIVH